MSPNLRPAEHKERLSVAGGWELCSLYPNTMSAWEHQRLAFPRRTGSILMPGFHQSFGSAPTRTGCTSCWEHDLHILWAGSILGINLPKNPHVAEKAQAYSCNTIRGITHGQNRSLWLNHVERFCDGLAVLWDWRSPGRLPKYVQWAWRMRGGKRLRVRKRVGSRLRLLAEGVPNRRILGKQGN